MSVENSLFRGCLGRLLSRGELANSGGRRERPLEKSWRARAQLASQHRGRHLGEGVWSEEEAERFGSESPPASNQRSVVSSLLTDEVHHGNNARPLRTRCVCARRETLHCAWPGGVLRSQQTICKVATYPSRSADKRPDSGSAERTIPLLRSKDANTISMSARTYRRRPGPSRILVMLAVSRGRIEVTSQ